MTSWIGMAARPWTGFRAQLSLDDLDHRAIYNNGGEICVLYLAYLAEEIRDGRENFYNV